MAKEIILFTDNDSHFLAARSQFLVRAGYQVLVAQDPATAIRYLEHERIDLAILDNRLMNDLDENDNTGIQIARQYAPDTPKIILTGYPTWKAVRNAMGRSLEDLPPVVDFVSKLDGPEALLQAIEWVLCRSTWRANLVQTFKVPTLAAVADRLNELRPSEGSRMLQESIDSTRRQLGELRALDGQQARQYHQWGLTMSIVGMGMILAGVGLFLAGVALPGAAPAIAGVITQAVATLFFQREDAAHRRINETMHLLEETDRLGNLFSLIDSLEDNLNREQYKKELLSRVLHKWFD